MTKDFQFNTMRLRFDCWQCGDQKIARIRSHLSEYESAVCHQSPFFCAISIWTIRQMFSPRNKVKMFDELSQMEIYAPQTKILENGTAGRACLFDVLCDGVSTRLWRRTLAKYVENTRPTC